jgi:hypothetical protein
MTQRGSGRGFGGVKLFDQSKGVRRDLGDREHVDLLIVVSEKVEISGVGFDSFDSCFHREQLSKGR